MSTAWFMFVMFIYICGTLLDGVMAGQSAMATTALTSNISEADTSISVASTQGFKRPVGKVYINKVVLCYTGVTTTTFTGITTGNDCDPASSAANHASGSEVRSEAMGVVNAIVGFDIMSIFADADDAASILIGTIKLMAHAPDFLVAAVKVSVLDFSFLDGNMVYLRIFILFVIGAGFSMGFIRLARGA